MFGELSEHLRTMAVFDVNTGLREQELCGLKWAWEQRIPELDSGGIQRSVFVLPAVKNKNKQARVVVLNDVAQRIVEQMRGQHPEYVFTWVNEDGVRDRVGRIRNSGWMNARRRAADRYVEVFGKEAPAGLPVPAGARPAAHLRPSLAGGWREQGGQEGSARSQVTGRDDGLQRR